MGTTVSDEFIQQDSYCEIFEQGLETLIRRARRTLARVSFDTMIGQGLSGSLFIPALARSMKKHYFIVRKEGENSHASYGVGEGRIGRRWLFVDDFISTGRTRETVASKVYEFCLDECWTTQFVGSYLYTVDDLRLDPSQFEMTNYV